MSQWLFILILTLEIPFSSAGPMALAAAPTPGTPDTSSGPAYRGEAKVLLDEGRSLFSTGRFAEAVYPLKRLIDRHPGAEGFLEAHLLLGQAYLKSGQAAAAVAPLRAYISTLLRNPDSAPYTAQLALAEAYLTLGKNSEALLLAKQMEKQSERTNSSPRADDSTRLAILLARTRALIALRKDADAESTIAAASTLISSTTNPELKARGNFLKLELKLRACSRLPSPGRLAEDQARDQFERRGTCLTEAVLNFRDTLQAGSREWGQQAQSKLFQAFTNYLKDCANPPKPPSDRAHGKRSAAQLRAYRSELKTALLAICRERTKEAQDLSSRWSPDFAKSLAELYQQGNTP